MKYDSGMTHFKNDITAALRHMLGNNSEITEKFSPNDGSPAPLRDYLKEKYGKSYTSHIGNGMRYSCKTSTGFELMFDTILNNPGDKNLTLSWSQTAKFIRDNWDEVFKKTKPKSRPLETLVRTFDEEAMTCPNWVRGKTLTYLEKVNGVHFECKAFSMEFCKLDDITSFFVKHCNCHENCPYFKETAEKQPSYLDKLREKYPKVNETDEWFDYCPAELFDGDDLPIVGDCPIKLECEDCWKSLCPADVDFKNDLEDFEADYFEQYPVEGTAEAAESVPENSEEKSETNRSLENQVATTTENALQSAFDYSELDNDTAKDLRECETVIRQETAGYFTLLGAKFKEAQALLANHASGIFEKWYTAMGFKRQTVYNLIQRFDFLGSPTIGGREDTFEALPLTLSYEVSKPDAPAELVEKVLDGDITTNAEYLKLKAELERTREECRQLDANSAAKDKEYERQLEEANKRAETEQKARESISCNLDNMEKGYVEFKDKYTDEYYKNIELEKRIKELENRPVDVAVQDNSELMEELEQLREENERLKADNVKSFLIRLTMDEYEELLKAVSNKSLLLDAIRHAKIIKL